MNILAIDSSTKNASVSVQSENTVISKNVLNEITHSEKLLPLIDEVLTDAGLTIRNIDMLACTKGPGSFTGIRIGISTVKALAHAMNIPIFSISTLLLISYIQYIALKQNNNNLEDVYICPIMDAKNDRIYYGSYKFSSNKLNGKINVSEIISASNDLIVNAIENIKNVIYYKNITYALDNMELKNKILECYNSEGKKNNIMFSSESILLDSKYIIQYINEIENLNEYIVDYLSFDAVYARMSQAERICNNEK